MVISFSRAQEAAARGEKQKVFDWDKAAALIAEHKPALAAAGLVEDWESTGGEIYTDGEPDAGNYTYLSSNWATPTLRFDDGQEFECFTVDHADWDADTKWPESALAILAGETK